MKGSIGFIAVGQAGGNIGSMFEKKGHSVIYFNTSQEDLKTLTGAKHTHHIKGGEGCNKDRNKAKDLIIDDFESILQQVTEKLTEEFIFVIFSSGGGTGSGSSPMLIDLLIQNTEKRVGAITIIPSEEETIRTYVNSYECFQELEAIDDLCATFVLDNNKQEDKLNINSMFVSQFSAFIGLSEHTHVRGNIDQAEIKEMLSTRGATVITKMNKPEKSADSTANLINSFKSGIFAPIESDRVVQYIGLSYSVPIEMEALCKEMGDPYDIYQGQNDTTTICILCGLSYPYTAIEKMKEKVQASQIRVVKNIEATQTARLQDDISFLPPKRTRTAPKVNPNLEDEPSSESAPDRKQINKNIFDKYKKQPK